MSLYNENDAAKRKHGFSSRRSRRLTEQRLIANIWLYKLIFINTRVPSFVFLFMHFIFFFILHSIFFPFYRFALYTENFSISF